MLCCGLQRKRGQAGVDTTPSSVTCHLVTSTGLGFGKPRLARRTSMMTRDCPSHDGEREEKLHGLPLPREILLTVFRLLPADNRLRCTGVCPSWRAFLTERSLWNRLNLSLSTSGCQRFSVGLFRAAVAKAGGQLSSLDVSGHEELPTRNFLRSVSSSLFSRQTRPPLQLSTWAPRTNFFVTQHKVLSRLRLH